MPNAFVNGRRAGPAAAWLLGALLGLPAAARADEIVRNLSTEFVEVLVEGVPLGARFVLDAKPVEMRNGGSIEMKVRYDAVVPMPSEMRAGYEPIPDAAWVSFEPRAFTLSPGGTSVGKVVLYIPDDPALVGRRFQVMLHLHTDTSQPGLLGVGLKPRFLFTVKAKGDRPDRVVVNPSPLARLLPYEFGAATGSLFFDCGKVKAENFQGEELTYEVMPAVEGIRRITVDPGETPLPDPAWLETSPRVLVLQPYTSGEFAVTARLPVTPEVFGKTYVTALHAVARRASAKPVEVWNKVRIIVPALPLSATGTGGRERR